MYVETAQEIYKLLNYYQLNYGHREHKHYVHSTISANENSEGTLLLF